jgi:hypothetical protein
MEVELSESHQTCQALMLQLKLEHLRGDLHRFYFKSQLVIVVVIR